MKKLLPKLTTFFFLILFVLTGTGMQPAFAALEPAQKDLYKRKVYYLDIARCSTDAQVGASEGGPLTGVHFPKVADKAVLAKAIDDYIKKGWPKSPLIGWGDDFVKYGEKYDVNPLISVVIAQVEYQFGTLDQYVGKGAPGQYNYWAVTHNSNSSTRFGPYNSIDEAMEAHVKLLAGVGDNAPGLTYIGPPQNMTTISQIMNQYAPSFENDTPNYIKTIIEGMKKILKDGGVTAGGAATDEVSETAGDSCICDTPAPADGSSETLGSRLQKLADENGGKTSISVQSITGKIKGAANGNVQMPTRSSYKIYTAYATLKAIEAGKISWDSTVKKESGNDGAFTSGTVEAAMERMIVNSDNAAASALRTDSRIGTPAQMNKLLRDAGLSEKTVMGTGSSNNPNGTNTKSTANDFAKFLLMLDKHDLPGVDKDSNYEKLLGFMKRATTDGTSARDGIAAGVKGVEVADKPGWASGSSDPASNDVGIVYLKDNPYVVAILTDKPNQWSGVAKIAEGVNAAMSDGLSADDCGDSTTSGDISSIVKAYAWPNHSASRFDPKAAYKKAYDAAKAKGQYFGGDYTDCGVFVTRVMIDSGFEPKYNFSGELSKGAGPTPTQEDWLRKNWRKITVKSTKDLQPGDVGINDQHTFLYVGKIDGFNDVFASASLHGRVPMAGQSDALSGAYNYYRKK